MEGEGMYLFREEVKEWLMDIHDKGLLNETLAELYQAGVLTQAELGNAFDTVDKIHRVLTGQFGERMLEATLAVFKRIAAKIGEDE